MQEWVALHVPVNPDTREGIINFLFEQNATGCVEEEVTIIAYFSASDYSEQLLARLTNYLSELTYLGFETDAGGIRIEPFAEQEWNLLWRKQFKPLKVTENCIVKPPWIELAPETAIFEITIDPKMAFGTGSHATTRFMLQLMEKYLKAGQSVLDVGTGTGILAIMAHLSGAQPIYAIDIDPIAIECARDSVQLNQCSEAIDLQVGTIDRFIDKGFYFDVILANIHKAVILSMLKQVNQLLVKAGLFFVSGILSEQQQEIIKAAENINLTYLDGLADDEWSAQVFKKG